MIHVNTPIKLVISSIKHLLFDFLDFLTNNIKKKIRTFVNIKIYALISPFVSPLIIFNFLKIKKLKRSLKKYFSETLFKPSIRKYVILCATLPILYI